MATVTVKPWPSIAPGAACRPAMPGRQASAGGSDRRAARGYRPAPRAARIRDSRRRGRAAWPTSGSTAMEVRPLEASAGRSSSPFWLEAAVLQRPEQQPERARRRLQQRRHVDVIGAEADAVFAQRRARFLVEALDLVGDLGRSSTPSASASWKAMPRAIPAMSSALPAANSGPSSFSMWLFSHSVEPRLRPLRARGRSAVRRRAIADAARAASSAGHQAGHRLAGPAQRAVVDKHERIVGGFGKPFRRASISPASAFCAAARSALASVAPPEASGANWKPARRPIMWPSTRTSPVLLISASSIAFSLNRRISTLVRRSTKRCGEPFMQRIGKLVLDAARYALPMLGIVEPVGPVGGKGPGADLGDAVGERVDVAVGAVGQRYLARRTSRREMPALPRQESIEGQRPARHGWPARSCGSRGPGRPPTGAATALGGGGEFAHLVLARRAFEHAHVVRDRRARQPFARRACVRGSRAGPRCEREIERGVAPLQHRHRLERVALEPLDEFRSRTAGQRPVVPKVPSRMWRARRGRRSAPARPAMRRRNW